jgi:hypothetical protein
MLCVDPSLLQQAEHLLSPLLVVVVLHLNSLALITQGMTCQP